jgi:hypothetical protein
MGVRRTYNGTGDKKRGTRKRKNVGRKDVSLIKEETLLPHMQPWLVRFRRRRKSRESGIAPGTAAARQISPAAVERTVKNRSDACVREVRYLANNKHHSCQTFNFSLCKYIKNSNIVFKHGSSQEAYRKQEQSRNKA